jgi:uncharacterized RDD family membrane protein YckC
MFCQHCGASLAAGAAFCATCGRPVAAGPAATIAAASPAAAAYAAPRPVYAGFWLRLVAYIVDALLLGIIGGTIFFLFLALGWLSWRSGRGWPAPGPEFFLSLLMPMILISVAIKWLYHAFLESSEWQATVGKKLVGVVVTDLTGNRIDFVRATWRHFAKILSGAILLIGYLMAGFTERKQALHDILAGTLVLRR